MEVSKFTFNNSPSSVIEWIEKAWTGEWREIIPSPANHCPTIASFPLEDPSQKKFAFFPAFGNISVFDTSDGLVLVDTGTQRRAQIAYKLIRMWSSKPVHTIIYTHGHIDQYQIAPIHIDSFSVCGVDLFDQEADKQGWKRPRVIAHKNIFKRFERYELTKGYNESINRRQFNEKSLEWPTKFREPDVTYDSEEFHITVGGIEFDLYHGKGETDDATWVFVPLYKAVCPGDFFIWSSPNCGNPQKVQRYPREWAQALRKMHALKPAVLFPGHGAPIVTEGRISQALSDTAEFLESISEQTLKLMNEGKTLQEILEAVQVPTHLAKRPYLSASYDHPQFIVRNIWRLYGGWWDRRYSSLLPGNQKDVSTEIVSLCGGVDKVVARVKSLVEQYHTQLRTQKQDNDTLLAIASHLIEYAFDIAPKDPKVVEARIQVYEARLNRETSLMARNIFREALMMTRAAL